MLETKGLHNAREIADIDEFYFAWGIVSCSWARHFALMVPFSTQNDIFCPNEPSAKKYEIMHITYE